MRQVCESYGGRRIDCLRNVSKKEGKKMCSFISSVKERQEL